MPPNAGTMASQYQKASRGKISETTIPVGTAYAIWTGIGAVGTFLLGIAFLGEPAKAMRFVSAGFIVMGIIGLKLTS